jgi:hypothetical protein
MMPHGIATTLQKHSRQHSSDNRPRGSQHITASKSHHVLAMCLHSSHLQLQPLIFCTLCAVCLLCDAGGPRVFVFVVESADDPAVAALQDMVTQQQQQQQLQLCGESQQQQQQQQGSAEGLPGSVLHAWQQGPQQVVLLLDAGLASTCSQKIHK